MYCHSYSGWLKTRFCSLGELGHLLRNSAVSSCTCCINLSFKLQGDLLQADFVSGESAMVFEVSKSHQN